jgi:hypothetical protein
MGQYLASDDVRKMFVDPLLALAAECKKLCDRWDQAEKKKAIARPDLLLNNVTPEAALGTLRKFVREANGKLDDAVAGVYRYRTTQHSQPRPLRRARRKK